MSFRARRLPLIVVLVLAGVAFGRVWPDGAGAGPRGVVLRDSGEADAFGLVTRVVDGDTVRVSLGGRSERVRYIGVDTPESVKPGVGVQCFAHAASDANARLVRGQRVRLHFDRESRDRYGRMLAYVFRARDGLFVNRELVHGGYARTLSIAPNTRHAVLFAREQAAARQADRGLWHACPP